MSSEEPTMSAFKSLDCTSFCFASAGCVLCSFTAKFPSSSSSLYCFNKGQKWPVIPTEYRDRISSHFHRIFRLLLFFGSRLETLALVSCNALVSRVSIHFHLFKTTECSHIIIIRKRKLHDGRALEEEKETKIRDSQIFIDVDWMCSAANAFYDIVFLSFHVSEDDTSMHSTAIVAGVRLAHTTKIFINGVYSCRCVVFSVHYHMHLLVFVSNPNRKILNKHIHSCQQPTLHNAVFFYLYFSWFVNRAINHGTANSSNTSRRDDEEGEEGLGHTAYRHSMFEERCTLARWNDENDRKGEMPMAKQLRKCVRCFWEAKWNSEAKETKNKSIWYTRWQ